MSINVEVWLYGPIARYARSDAGSHARLEVEMPEGSTVSDLIRRLGVPADEQGPVFLNGKLTAMPGLQPDPSPTLHDGDRVGVFHRRSMWPFQYRFGAQMTTGLQEEMRRRADGGVRHAYTSEPPTPPGGGPSTSRQGEEGRGGE